MTQAPIRIGNHEIAAGGKPFFIAEIGSNHNGDMALCRQLIDAAVKSGADAVKFQSWSSTSLVSRAEYESNTQYSDKKKHFGSLKEMVERYQFTPEAHREMARYCKDVGIIFSSSVFSPEEVDLLESLNAPFHKIASMDVNNIVLLDYVAQTCKPVVLSTGMAEMKEIERAVDILQTGGAQVILMHCVSLYPPADERVRLANITSLRNHFAVPIGFSDHTLGDTAAVAAIALGACMLEKHFTLDTDMEGWDHAISADPAMFASIVERATSVWKMMGDGERIVSKEEIKKRKQFRRCIVAAHALKKGDVISLDDLRFKRPGTGIPPDEYEALLGKVLLRDIDADDALAFQYVR